ncbi:phage capsid protein [Blautia massiliensis]|uniref:phage capsid protein n=1 Tax=Blautia massiliensis (ex Durand et al. 2017) TaxID=1737424 RepID=UPI00156F5DDF|nr:phage capsid protein [Blautia massiliensis (ex Durand et al. 2017)]NSK79802.1 phage capsid protein [Blautia massiliensis (ex Durand et al. 2017)]
MALNYAEQWSPELLEILMQGTLTSPFVTSNVRWLDAKTFHFTQMSTSGYKNHSREGGWNKGTYTQTDVPYTLTHDRDVEFMVDKADVDETNATASIQNISRIFEQTWVVPETDALFFSKVAQAAQKTEGYHGSTAASAYTKAKVFGMLKDILAKGKLRRYKANGTLIMYVTSQIMDSLEQSTEFTRKIEMTQIAEGGMGIETRVTDIDGVPIMEVIDDERFYDAFDWEPEGGGFAPLKKVAAASGVEAVTGAHKINVLVACGQTCKTVPKINSIYYFEPGGHTKGDGYLYQNRSFSDVFVFPNGRDGKIDSIYVDVDTTEVA